MRNLFEIALKRHRHLSLVVCMFIAMILLTISSQMEIMSIGILSQKGPEFFELFAPLKKKTLQSTDKITTQDLMDRWEVLDADHKGYVTREDTLTFITQVNRSGLVDKVVHKLNEWVPITGHPLRLALLVFLVALFKAICLFWHRFTARLVAIRVSRDLRQDYFEHIQILPMSFYQKHNIGGLSSRVVNDAFLISEGINATLINFFETPFTITTTLLLCFLASWKLSIFIFVGFPLIIYPIVLIARKVKKIAKQLQKNQESFSSVLIDYLAGIQTVKVFAMEEFSLNKYREQNHKMAALEQRSARYDVSSRPVVHTIAMLFLSAALISGLYIFDMSIPEILVYCGFLYIFYEPVKKFAEQNVLIQRGAAAAERMQEVMKIQPQIQDAPNAVPLKEFTSHIEFKNVSFKYEDEWVLKDVSFTIKKGQTAAIVGPTGSGKSTIVQLIPRLYDPQKGDILIDGKPLKSYTQASLRENIGFVPQKPFLFLDTIAANISFGRPYSKEAIDGAAERAFAKEFIVKLPLQYETPLAEMGKNLSGGQQQRLAIARALLKNAPILILDEATSSLDAISENHIQQAVKNLHGEVTQIIIAHRLSTIEDADKIIFIHLGEKIAEGTKDELLKTCPPFKLMWEMMHRKELTPL